MYKKAIKILLFTLCLSVMAFTFTACEDDKDYKVTIKGGIEDLIYDSVPSINTLKGEEALEKTGYEIEGLYLDENFLEAFNPSNYSSLNSNLTIYVKFKAKEYVIYLNANGGDYDENQEESYSIKVNYGADYSLPIPKKDGMDFNGYKNIQGNPFSLQGKYEIDGSSSLIAQWTNHKYSIKFYDATKTENNELGEELKLEYNDKISSLPQVEAGYEIEDNKVYSDKDCTTLIDLSTYKVVDDASLYVKVVPKTYKIIVNEATGVDTTVKYKENYSLTEPTLEGFTFEGFIYNGQPFAKEGDYNYTHDITITATWKAIEGYNDRYLTYYDDQNQIGNPVKYTKGDTILASSLIVYNKEGYKFDGWYIDSEFNTPFNDTVITENIKLYGKFTANEYTISFNTDGGSNIEDYTATFNSLYSLKIPTKKGYEFVKYQYNGNDFALSGTYNISKDIVLKAVWVEYFEDGEKLAQAKPVLFTQRVNEQNSYYFKDKISGSDKYTYVFLKGAKYDFGAVKVSSTDSTSLVEFNSESVFTVLNKAGTFTINFTLENGQEYSRNAIIVEYVESLSDSTTGRNKDNFRIDMLEALDVGVNNFIPNVTIKSTNTGINLEYANVNISVKDDGGNVIENAFTLNGNSLTFNTQFVNVGGTYTIELAPRYQISVGNAISFKVKFNEGVNVYTHQELRENFANLSVHEINILRSIKTELEDSQYYEGKKENGPIKEVKSADENGVPYLRLAQKGDEMKLHGNNFSIDASSLPHANGYYEESWVEPMVKANKVLNQHIFIFDYECGSNTLGHVISNSGTFNVDNLAVFGNNVEPSNIIVKKSDDDGYLKMSGSYNGIRVNGGTATFDNVSIKNTVIGLFVTSGVDEDSVDYASKITLNDSIINNSWANSICLFNLTTIDITNTYIGNSGGASIHFDDRAYEESYAGDLMNVLNIDALTEIDNFVTGEEAWFGAYGKQPLAAAVKQLLEQQLNPAGFTCLKDAKFNFAVFTQSAGGHDSEDWLADPQLGPIFATNLTPHPTLGESGIMLNVVNETTFIPYIQFPYGDYEARIMALLPIFPTE